MGLVTYIYIIRNYQQVIFTLWQWSLDAVEKREFAGKKAKLAAAELGKLSRRVFGELFNYQSQVSINIWFL
jgi:hypothetical protein